MRRCPICKRKAESPHHIKSRANGGGDKPSNIIWLCGECHNRLEGTEVTPEIVKMERIKRQGEKDMNEELYSFMIHDDCIIFVGIMRGNEVVERYNIKLPKSTDISKINIKKLLKKGAK